MKKIAIIFKVHQPFRLRKYRFFDIGETHDYYDDYQNQYALKRFAEQSYRKANALMNDLLTRFPGKFAFSFAFSGTAMDQMQWYAPDLLADFKALAAHQDVELLAAPYSCSLGSLISRNFFCSQVEAQRLKVQEIFGKTPTVLLNTDLIYSDEIGKWASEMNFKGMMTEGARHILGWKSPHYTYRHPEVDLPLLLRDPVLSEHFSLRFSNRAWDQWPYTVDKFLHTVRSEEGDTQVVLYLDYAVLGEFQPEDSGIFEFFSALAEQVCPSEMFAFATPAALCALKPVADLHIPSPISCVDEERDLTACYGNDLQRDALVNLKRMWPLVEKSQDPEIIKDFTYLTGSDHLHFMSTKWFSDTPSPRYVRPYDSPYDGYINYMNVLSDLAQRIGLD